MSSYSIPMTSWENFRISRLKSMAKECNLILDFGESAREHKSFFTKDQYKTADLDPTIKPDIVGDICDLNMIKDQSYDGLICCAVLEHVYNPFKAVEEMHRILKPNGYFFGYVPFLYPYHAKKGHYSDYFRYTHEGVEYLFKNFKDLEICAVRGNLTTFFNLLPGRLNKVQKYFKWADKYFSGIQVSGYYFSCRRSN